MIIFSGTATQTSSCIDGYMATRWVPDEKLRHNRTDSNDEMAIHWPMSPSLYQVPLARHTRQNMFRLEL